jgi:hypothetical protein
VIVPAKPVRDRPHERPRAAAPANDDDDQDDED